MWRKWKHRQVGLALGSGGARGWAHLGVLEVLRERGIRAQVVAGTSMGALMGAFFAAGREQVLHDLSRDLDWGHLRQFFWELTLSRSGLTDGRRLLEETAKLLDRSDFRELEIPFRAVATDLKDGGEVVLAQGDLLLALRASISIPGLFSPVQVGDRFLVDGGLVNPVPVNVARAMGAERVIAVDVSQGMAVEEWPSVETPREERDESGRPAVPLRLPRQTDEEEESGAVQVLRHFWDDIERKVRRLKTTWQERESRPDMLEVLVRSVRIMEGQIARTRRAAEPPDLLIEPRVEDIGTLDFQKAREAIAAGREAALAALD